MKRIVAGVAILTAIVSFAVSAQQQVQCSPDQVSNLEFSLGSTLQAKAAAESKVRQLETELASTKKELDALKNPPKKEKDEKH